jgi:hypothetical protein
MTGDRFGPWVAGIDAVERAKQFRSLAALAAAFCGSGSELALALRAAEQDLIAAPRALELLGKMPALTRRRMLSVFGAVTWPAKRPPSVCGGTGGRSRPIGGGCPIAGNPRPSHSSMTATPMSQPSVDSNAALSPNCS